MFFYDPYAILKPDTLKHLDNDDPYSKTLRRLVKRTAKPPSYSRFGEPLHVSEVDHVANLARPFEMRQRLTHRYAFAVPSRMALIALKSAGPIVQMGAGTGYWARCLEQKGADVVAIDKHPIAARQKNHFFGHHGDPKRATWRQVEWFPVQEGTTAALRGLRDRALLLCWPPMKDHHAKGEGCMASEAVGHWRGSILGYIGEGAGGCTGSADFFRLLKRMGYVERTRVGLPQYSGIHDALYIFTR